MGGVAQVTIDGAAGGAGGCNNGGAGAPGETRIYNLTVTPGATYYMYVGAQGTNGTCGGAGGVGGGGGSATGGHGGAGNTTGGGGGGGGGDSTIRTGSATGPVLVSAAGGGGGGGGSTSAGGTGGSGGTQGTSAGQDGPSAGDGGGGGGGAGYVSFGAGGAGGDPSAGGNNGTGLSGASGGFSNGGNGSISIQYTAMLATNAATAITATGATLNGTDPNGDSYHFAYGTDTTYALGNVPSPDATATSDTVSYALTGLTPNTTYHYELQATSGNGGDVTFKTLYLPVTGTASSITATSAILNGSDPNNNGEACEFDWGPTSSPQTYPNSVGALGSSAAPTASLGGLTQNTTYHYILVCASGSGSDASFTTGVPPTTGSATSITGTTATLQGTDPNKGEHFHFEYGTTTSYGRSTTTGTSTGGTVAGAATGLKPGTTYHFRIVSDSGAGADASFTTATVDSAIVLKGPKVGKVKGKLTYHLTFVNVGSATNTLPLAHLSFAGRHHKIKYLKHRRCSGKTTLLCHFGQLGGGQKKTLTIVVRDLHKGKLKVRAAILFVGKQTDPTPSNNTAQLVTRVTKKGKVKTTSFSPIDTGIGVRGPDQATEGAKLRYHVTLKNTGTQAIKHPLYFVRFFGQRQDIELLAHRHCKVKNNKTLICQLPALASGKKRGLTFVIRYHNTGKLKVHAQIYTGHRRHDATRSDDVAILVTKVTASS